MAEEIKKEEQQIKSRQRVAERGEVFTAEREVNAMLDLVKQETERASRGDTVPTTTSVGK